MRLSNIMTSRVECVDPDATVEEAAKRMLRNDVGSIPVAREGRPLGMLTDRDIAIRVAALGRNPSITRVREVMTGNLVCCHAADSVETAAAVMEKNQVRRLLILDDDDCICGIVSLGDLALRSSDDMLTEEVLEEVSWPGHLQDLPGGGREWSRSRFLASIASRRARRAAMVGATAFAAGAAAMYFFDPQKGRRRRTLIRDKAVRLAHDAQCALGKSSRYAAGQARGVLAGATRPFKSDHADDHVLVERVRAALGRAVSHPRAVEVQVRDGVAHLSGCVPADEVRGLLSRVKGVRGIRGIEDRLQVRQSPGAEPSLQGGSPQRSRQRQFVRENWSPTTRLVGALAGAGLLGWGLWRRDLIGAGALAGGSAIFGRSITNLPATRLTGIGAGRRAVDVQKTININAPVDTVFDFMANYDNFPQFMSRVLEVKDLGGGRSHWVVKGPAGIHVSWDAEITRVEPNEIIAWRSVPGSMIGNAGHVRVESNETGGTRIDIRLSYNPPGGALGHLAAMLFGADPKSDMDADLARLKTTIETGHAPHDAAQPVYRNRMFSSDGRERTPSQRGFAVTDGLFENG